MIGIVGSNRQETTKMYTAKTERTGVSDEEYNIDKKGFYRFDAKYTEETGMEGKSFETTGVTYRKTVSFHNKDNSIWGTWMEIRTVHTEPIFEAMFTRHLGGNIYEQTVRKVGETEYEDVEYFVYGEGFEYMDGSKYFHEVRTVMFGKVE